MKAPPPILLTELFPPLERELIDLVRSLAPDEWAKPTVCAGWSVKDVASHLLDTALRRLSMQRDGYWPAPPDADLSQPSALVAYVNRLNASWVQATQPLSPQLLIAFLEQAGEELVKLFRSLDPKAPAIFGVSWAGEQSSPNWFDVAREFTERWHHQQQIRDATGRPPLTGRKFLFPVLDTFMRALPYAFRAANAAEDSVWEVRVEGEAGGRWFLVRREQRWKLCLEANRATGTVTLPQDVAWRLLTKGMTKEKARAQITLDGPPELAERLLNLICIVG